MNNGFLLLGQSLSFYGIIPSISLSKDISEKYRFNLFTSTTIDAFSREISNINYPSSDLQIYIQPNLIIRPNKPFVYTMSYTYQRNNPFNSSFVNEHRIWQQVTYTKQFDELRWTNRFRIDERFIENKSTVKYPFSTRLRYQIGFSSPIFQKKCNNRPPYFLAYNEFYLSLFGAKNAWYSENWTYAGIGFTLSDKTRLEVGYLFQTLVRDQAKDLRFLHLCQINWVYNM